MCCYRYLGKKQAAEILIGGLARLEYRGYDSAGLAIVSDGKMIIKKKVTIDSSFISGLGSNQQTVMLTFMQVGKVKELRSVAFDMKVMPSTDPFPLFRF